MRMSIRWFVLVLLAGPSVLAEEKPKPDKPALLERYGLLQSDYQKDELERRKQELDKESSSYFSLRKIVYEEKTFWVMEFQLPDGDPCKQVGLYAPNKDGSHRICFFAQTRAVGWLELKLDTESGLLELREAASSRLKGQLILACNLKAIGTGFSTR